MDPLKVFESPDTSVEVACAALCLFAQRCHTGLGRAAIQSSRIAYYEKRPGKTALFWLLRNQTLKDTNVRTASYFARSITLALVAEGANDVLRDWIVAHQPIRPSQQAFDYHKRTSSFGNFKIRGALEALCYWTVKRDRFADAFSLLRFCVEKYRHGHYLPLSGPAGWLVNSLQAKSSARTSAEAYDWFAASRGLHHYLIWISCILVWKQEGIFRTIGRRSYKSQTCRGQ